MKRFLTLAALAFAVLTTSAQREPKLTIKAGAGLSSVVGADANTKIKVAAKIGAAYDLKLYKELYLIPELDFALKGFNPDGVNFITLDNVVHMTYLQAPIQLAYRFRLKKGGNIVVKAGPYFACGLFGSKATISGWGFRKEVDVFDKTYGFRRFDVGIGTGLAFERNHFTIGLEYSRGLHRLHPDFRLYNQAFGITLGYRL
ncbi:MAG: porin family protein [Bacteroidaceae bacterium]|nr:porin family protein [Bacteroidaceae bacterium]